MLLELILPVLVVTVANENVGGENLPAPEDSKEAEPTAEVPESQ